VRESAVAGRGGTFKKRLENETTKGFLHHGEVGRLEVVGED